MISWKQRIVVIACAVFSCASFVAHAALPPVHQQELIAKILIELPRYIHFSNSHSSPPVLCIADKDFLTMVALLNAKKKTYARIQDTTSLAACNIVYAGQPKQARRLLTATATQRVAIISNYSTFVDEGGAIGLVDARGSIRIELNLTVAKEKDINFSPDLIELSGRVIQ